MYMLVYMYMSINFEKVTEFICVCQLNYFVCYSYRYIENTCSLGVEKEMLATHIVLYCCISALQ